MLLTLWGCRVFFLSFTLRGGWVYTGKKERPREVEIGTARSVCSGEDPAENIYVPDIRRNQRLGARFSIHVVTEHRHRSRVKGGNE